MEIIGKSNDIKIVLFVLAGFAIFLLLAFLLCKVRLPERDFSRILVSAIVFLFYFVAILVLDLNGCLTTNTVKITEPEYIRICLSNNTGIKEIGDDYIIAGITDVEIRQVKEKAAKNKLLEKYAEEGSDECWCSD